MNTELIAVNPSEFGIEETKANELIGNLPQIKSERNELEKQFDAIIKMDIENPETSVQAKELRKRIKENRTKGIEVWHKTTKEFFLRGGQFVDAIKRKEIAVNERMENSLEEIEKHFENKERERKESLRVDRTQKLQSYSEFAPMSVDYSEISEDEFEKILSGAKMQFEAKQDQLRKEEEARKEAERIAEEERVAKEKAEAEERERIRKENEQLKAEAEAKEKMRETRNKELRPYIMFIRDYNSLLNKTEDEYQKEFSDIKKGAEDHWEHERKEQIKKAQEEEQRMLSEKKRLDEAAAKLKAEQEAKAKLEAELKAKKEAEEKAEKERMAEIERQNKEAEKLAKAPIKKQLTAWVDSFSLGKPVNENDITIEIERKFESFRNWAKQEIEKL